MRTLAVAMVLSAAVGAVSAWSAEAKAPHPHFRDGGVISWATKLADAQRSAKAAGKLILVEYGREA